MKGDPRLITCILPKGKAIEVVRLLKEEKGIIAANVHTGRGLGTVPTSISYGEWSEEDILTVTVNQDRADEIFEFIYDRSGMKDTVGSFMYQARLSKSTTFSLPELPREEG